jgi:hypothetical protein
VNVKLWKAVDKRFLASDIKGAIQDLEDLLASALSLQAFSCGRFRS